MRNYLCNIAAKDNEFYSQLAGDIIFLRGIMYVVIHTGIYSPNSADPILCYRSHPDITERFYPHLFKKYFPDGMPKHLIRTETQIEG